MSEIRTPPSLKWLLDKRARLLGEIKRLEKGIPAARESLSKDIADAELQLAQLKAQQHRPLVDELVVQAKKADLAAIDRALQLHTIQVDTQLISPIWPHSAKNKLPYGQTTRFIYRYLKTIYPESASAAEVAEFILSVTELNTDSMDPEQIRLRVRKQMRKLAAEGKLAPVHPKKTHLEGRWRLSQTMPGPDQKEALLTDDSPANSLSTSEINRC